MTSKVVGYEPCPRCRSMNRDTKGDNLVRYADGGAHCFSCKYHEGTTKPHLTEVKSDAPKSLLPFDFTREIPADALRWLLQYGLPWSYWKETIGFSPSEQRLVFKVGSPLQFSIGRLIGEPKGETHAKRRKWYVWGDSHKHCEVVQGQNDACTVLVEDIVSAHKIALAGGYTTIPLFGVELHPCHLYYLIGKQKPIYFWLDWDQLGTIMPKASRLQSIVGQPVKTIFTEKDPKHLSGEQIYEAINRG